MRDERQVRGVVSREGAGKRSELVASLREGRLRPEPADDIEKMRPAIGAERRLELEWNPEVRRGELLDLGACHADDTVETIAKVDGPSDDILRSLETPRPDLVAEHDDWLAGIAGAEERSCLRRGNRRRPSRP